MNSNSLQTSGMDYVKNNVETFDFNGPIKSLSAEIAR